MKERQRTFSTFYEAKMILCNHDYYITAMSFYRVHHFLCLFMSQQLSFGPLSNFLSHQIAFYPAYTSNGRLVHKNIDYKEQLPTTERERERASQCLQIELRSSPKHSSITNVQGVHMKWGNVIIEKKKKRFQTILLKCHNLSPTKEMIFCGNLSKKLLLRHC